MAARKKKETPSLRFDQKLALNQWLLSLFERGSFDDLAEPLRPLELEGLDENGSHKFLHQMRMLWEFKELPGDTLLGYDQNIVRHTLALSEKRAEPLQWKYFQYLSLLFTEIYLDRFFRDPAQLLVDLNTHLATFNQDRPARDQVNPFEITDLRKLAFWNATGSGKTLLMHVNIQQYQHYLDLHGRSRELNRTILLTPNEGLSRQHLEEFEASGIHAEIFSKDQGSLFAGRAVEILEVSKLREEMGEKTVAVDAFEGNNLVLIDEGHRGASGETWMGYRNRLCENGFSFEYSATFGQAMKGRKDLEQVYARNILFDYSYRYFYRDGFGKDYRILNLADDSDEAQRTLYFTACLLAFYQQQKLYAADPAALRPYLLEKPLWVFVGGSVNAVRTSNKRKVSDVVDILLTLAAFVQNRSNSIEAIQRLLEGNAGLLDKGGKDIFADAYPHLATLQQPAEMTFEDILKTLFNAPGTAALHVDHLKGSEGEIALSLGGNRPFGVINVGDAANLCKLCEAHSELVVIEQDFSDSLFRAINDTDSTINLLIGSKKFTEGWNSWRVSTMGLMNIGKKEGSEIIQLFGRGVRLKGHGNTLKRSSQLPGVDRPKRIGLLETLNVFGIHADYMRQFREYLEDEGLPGNENPLEFILPTLRSLEDKVLTGKKLTSIRIQEGKDFKRDGPKPTLGLPPDQLLRHPIALDWYPRIEADQSKGLKRNLDTVEKHEGKLEEQHLAFMNFDAIWFELQHFKAERSWYNLNLPREILPDLLAPANNGWYRLFIPAAELTFSRFEQVRRWEEIATALLKKYIDRFYKFHKQAWESQFYEYHTLQPDHANFVQEYRLYVDESHDDLIDALNGLKEQIENGDLQDWAFPNLQATYFDRHLYQPLLSFRSSYVEVSPVSLNEGEIEFVTDLRDFCTANPDFFKDRELYLLRNMSRGRGIGFFEAGNFYPDFLLWLLVDGKQYVTFVDPKGIRNLEGPEDPKIRFFRTIKALESQLGDATIILNSFVIANTPFQQVRWWTNDLKKETFTRSHVLFQVDDRHTYIKQLLTMITGDQPVMKSTGEVAGDR